MNHYRKTIKKYWARQTNGSCPFCDTKTKSDAQYEDEYVYIAPNLTKYDLWELHDVEEHLLLIPTRHIENISELNKQEQLAIMEQIARYEKEGFSIYARGRGFIKRSVKHQHTHLIKVSNKKPRLAIFLQKPYYLFKK